MPENQNKSERVNNWFVKNQIAVVFITLFFILMLVADYGLGYSATRIVLILIIMWVYKKIAG